MNVNLILNKKNGTRKCFHLPSSVTIIGRRQECDLCIPLMEVSRRHCEINYDENQLKIRDLGSRNGTFLNNQRIEEETPITAGDEIKIGPLSFTAQVEGNPVLSDVHDSATLQRLDYLSTKDKDAADRAGEFSAEEYDMNQTYEVYEILNGDEESQNEDKS